MVQPHPAIRSLAEIIIALRALNLAYHQAHILASGPNFAGDHELLQRLYFGKAGEPILEIDTVMERLQGVDPEEPLNLHEVLQRMAQVIPRDFSTTTSEQRWVMLLNIEKAIQTLLAGAIEVYDNEIQDYGVSNMLQTILDAHQVNIYLIQQRLG